MDILAIKSFVDCAACASETFAPIDVPLFSSWLDITNSLFKDLQSVVKKFVGLDKVAEELAAKLGDIQAAYVIGDYAKGIDSGLIDLVLVGQVDDEKLKEVTEKTEGLIDRKIRTLVLKQSDLKKLDERLDLKHALLIWGNGKVKGDVE